MKKLLVGLALVVASVPAFAQHGAHHRGHHVRYGHHHHHHHHHGHWHHGRWVAPLVIGAGVTYWATRPAPIVIQEPVIVERDTIINNCTEWREIQTSDGKIYRERTCYTQQ